MMEYRVVFDVTHYYGDWRFAAFGLLFIAIGIGLVHFRELIRPMTVRPLRGIFPFLFLGFAIVWTIVAAGITYRDHVRAVDALENGRAQMLEGRVSQFVSWQKGESFVLEGKKFSYSDYLITGCFNNMSSHGGPMHEGVRVRLWTIHVNAPRPEGDGAENCIVKLEMARDDGP